MTASVIEATDIARICACYTISSHSWIKQSYESWKSLSYASFLLYSFAWTILKLHMPTQVEEMSGECMVLETCVDQSRVVWLCEQTKLDGFSRVCSFQEEPL